MNMTLTCSEDITLSTKDMERFERTLNMYKQIKVKTQKNNI